MRKLLVLALLAFVSCKPWWDVSDNYDPQFSEILPIGASSPQQIGQWLRANIEYVSDKIHDMDEYWQSPDQTYQWRSGDCEDYAVLMMYMIHKELGGWPKMVIGRYQGGYHGWVEHEGRYYEPQLGTDVTNNPDYSEVTEKISYGITMWRSMNTHKTIGGDNE